MIWRFRSIAARIVTLHVIAILTVSICLPLLLLLLLNSAANQLQRLALGQRAEEIARHLVVGSDGQWHLDLSPSIRGAYVTGSGYVYAVVDSAGKLLFASDLSASLIDDEDMRRAEPTFRQRDQKNHRFAALSVPFEDGDARVWIETAQDLAHRDALIDDVVAGFLPNVAWVTLPVLALLLAADLAIFSRALRPLNDASRLAAKIGPATTEIRLPVAGMPRELVPLIAAVNHALDRLAHGFRFQREFTADAAHELRTPLAVLRAHVDLMEDHGNIVRLRDDLLAMNRLVDQLLDVAEVDALVVDPEERADLVSVCTDVATFLVPLAIKSKRDIAAIGPGGPVWVHGNAEALFHAVKNLAENAMRYTPEGTTVELEVQANGCVRVLDCGPGVPENEQTLVFQRFWRRHRRQDGGAGLGLSIVARIAEAHGGRVSVTNRPTGGAEFMLDLSAALVQPMQAA